MMEKTRREDFILNIGIYVINAAAAVAVYLIARALIRHFTDRRGK